MTMTKETNSITEATMNEAKKDTYKTTYHRDGTATYWSVYTESWVRRADSLADREYAAMSATTRVRVMKHLSLVA